MRINYNILWLDDDKDALDNGREEQIKEYLQSKGFNPNIQHYYNVNDAEKNEENYNRYDLILSDFNLDPSKTKTGAFFINLIRSKNIITEILLYSANSIDINKIIDDYGYLNRVTICNIRNLDENIIKLIDITIKKTQDISSLRGLIMSETTTIDNSIEKIILEISNIDEFKDIVSNCKIDETGIIRENLVKKFKLIDSKKYGQVYKDDMLFSAKPKYDLLCDIINKISENDENLQGIVKRIGNYGEIIRIRNEFGHCEQIVREDGTECLKVKDIEKEYDEQECIDLRKNIREYNLAFEELYQYIVSIKDESAELTSMKSS